MIVPRIKVSSFDPNYITLMRILYHFDKAAFSNNSCPFNENGFPYMYLYAQSDFWIHPYICNTKAHIHVLSYFKPDSYREKILDVRIHGIHKHVVYSFIVSLMERSGDGSIATANSVKDGLNIIRHQLMNTMITKTCTKKYKYSRGTGNDYTKKLPNDIDDMGNHSGIMINKLTFYDDTEYEYTFNPPLHLRYTNDKVDRKTEYIQVMQKDGTIVNRFVECSVSFEYMMFSINVSSEFRLLYNPQLKSATITYFRDKHNEKDKKRKKKG